MKRFTFDELIKEFDRDIDNIDRDSLISLTDDVIEYTEQYKKALEEILEVGYTSAFGGGIEYTGENHGECRKIANKALKS